MKARVTVNLREDDAETLRKRIEQLLRDKFPVGTKLEDVQIDTMVELLQDEIDDFFVGLRADCLAVTIEPGDE